jgi:hypothetical protein
MASETQRKYQRRSAEGWRALLAQQAVSGLTIGAFCRKVSVSVTGRQYGATEGRRNGAISKCLKWGLERC